MTLPFRYEGVGQFLPTDSRYLYKPTVGLSRGARAPMKPATDRPADKRLEKGQETRRAIIDTAMRLFAERGYAAVSIEAVFEAVEVDVTAKVMASAASVSCAVDAVRAGCDAFLDLTQNPVVRQIMLTDAPSVLGWEKWREIDERHAFGLMKAALEPAAKEAGIPATLVDAFAHMLLASLSEIALLIAEADDASSALENGKGAVRELLGRILARPA